jgi:tetratricopeptide (TPR) repeat protein
MTAETAESPTLFSRAAFFALLALIVVLPWSRGAGYVYAGFFREFVAQGFTCLMLILLAADIFQSRGKSFFRFSLLPAAAMLCLLLFCLWSCLSYFWSTDTLATAKQLRMALPWTALVFCTATIVNACRNKPFVFSSVMSISALLASSAWLAGKFWPEVSHLTGRLQWPYDHPAALGGYLVFPCIALSVSLIWTLRQRHFKFAVPTAMLLFPCLLALFATGTRACFVGVAAGLWLGIFLLFTGKTRSLILLCGLLGFAAAVSLTVYRFTGEKTPGACALLEREGKEGLYVGTFGTRVLFGSAAGKMGLAKPLAGFGAGTFPVQSVFFEDKDNFLHGQRGDVVYSAHSEPLQIFAETGAIGLLLYLLAHLLPVISASRKGAPVCSILAAAGLFGMFADSCGSMSLRYSELPWSYALVFGLALGSFSPAEKDRPGKSRNLLPAVCAGLMILSAGVYVTRYALPAFHAQRYFHQANTIRKTAAPDSNYYKVELLKSCALLSRARKSAGDFYTWYYATQFHSACLERAGEIIQAKKSRADCLRHFPGDAVNRKELARLFYLTGEPEKALRLCLAGLKIDPSSGPLQDWLEVILRGSELAQLDGWLEHSPPGFLNSSEEDWLRLLLGWLAGNRQETVCQNMQYENISIGLPRLVVARWNFSLRQAEKGYALLVPLIEKRPADPRALALAADYLAKTGTRENVEQALQLIDRAVRLGRTLPEVVSVAAPVFILSGSRREEAINLVTGALRDNPRNAILHKVHVETLWRLGRTEEAKLALRQAQPFFLKTENAQIYYSLAKLFEPSAGETEQP